MSSHPVGASSQKQVKQQIASQLNVLDNLRYEGEVVTDKLIKLRSTRQDLEAELFALKHKRIKLLEVIQHLEDEEMALVGEVASIIRFKRKVLQEVPLLEQRGRAAAGLAVVQDYLLASVQHLQHLAGQQDGSAFEVAAAAAAPSWSGTAQVQRPSATWDMRYMPAALAPKAAASTQTDAAELEAAQLRLESLQLEDSSPAPTAQQPAGGQQEAPGLAVRKAYSTNPFASVTAGQLLQLQHLEEGGSSDALPPLPEGQPLCSRAASAFSSSLYRSESLRTPLDSSMRGPSSEFRSNPGGPTNSRDSGSVVSLGSTASSGSMQRTGSINSRTSAGAGAAVAAGVAAGAAAGGFSAAVVGSPSGSFNSAGHRAPPRRPSGEEVSSVGAGRRPVGRTGSGQGLAPSPPPPPPMRSRSGSLAAIAAAEQGQLSQQIQQLQVQQQQQQQAALHAQRVQQHQQQQQQVQQQQQHLQQQQLQQQLQQQDSDARYRFLLAQRQQLALQHQQQQALLQQMSGLHGPLGPLDYEHSSAGTLEVPSIPGSSLASLHSSTTLPGGLSGSLPASSLLRGASAGTSDPLWGLPSGTLVLGGGEGGSCDLTSALTGLPAVLRQQQQRASWSSQGQPSGDQFAAAAAAAGLGPPAAVAADQQRLLLEEALEFACVGNDGIVSRPGSGSSQQRLQLAPGGLGPAVAANLMGLLPSPDPTVQAASLYTQQHMQGGGQ